jgi:hypothetical protein
MYIYIYILIYSATHGRDRNSMQGVAKCHVIHGYIDKHVFGGHHTPIWRSPNLNVAATKTQFGGHQNSFLQSLNMFSLCLGPIHTERYVVCNICCALPPPTLFVPGHARTQHNRMRLTSCTAMLSMLHNGILRICHRTAMMSATLIPAYLPSKQFSVSPFHICFIFANTCLNNCLLALFIPFRTIYIPSP